MPTRLDVMLHRRRSAFAGEAASRNPPATKRRELQGFAAGMQTMGRMRRSWIWFGQFEGMKSHNARDNFGESLSARSVPGARLSSMPAAEFARRHGLVDMKARLSRWLSLPVREGVSSRSVILIGASGRAIQMPNRISAPPRLWTRRQRLAEDQPSRTLPRRWPRGRSRGTRRLPAAARARWREAPGRPHG